MESGIFSINGNVQVTNEKDQFRIFATVIASVKDFINQHPGIDKYTFTADKGENSVVTSRSKLYDRMVKRFASSSGFVAQTSVGQEQVSYTLVRKK